MVAKKSSTGTAKKKNCQKGWPCGGTCLSRTKESCKNALQGQSKTFSGYLKTQAQKTDVDAKPKAKGKPDVLRDFDKQDTKQAFFKKKIKLATGESMEVETTRDAMNSDNGRFSMVNLDVRMDGYGLDIDEDSDPATVRAAQSALATTLESRTQGMRDGTVVHHYVDSTNPELSSMMNRLGFGPPSDSDSYYGIVQGGKLTPVTAGDLGNPRVLGD